MKKLIFIISLSIAVTTITAQSWISSSRVTSTTDQLFEFESVIDNSGNVYTFGRFNESLGLPGGTTVDARGGVDYFLVKFLPDGDIDWAKSFGSVNDESRFGGGVDVDDAGNVYVTGGFQLDFYYSDTEFLTSTGALDAFLLKIGSDGTVAWGRNIGTGAFLQYSTSLAVDQAGDVIVAGAYRDSITFNATTTLYSELFKFGVFYAKFSSADGTLSWAKQGTTNDAIVGQNSTIYGLLATTDAYYLTGIMNDTVKIDDEALGTDHKLHNAFLIKTDLDGNVSWHRTISGNDTESSQSITLDDEDNVYVSSYFYSDTIFIQSGIDTYAEEVVNKDGTDIFVVKYDAAGNMDWNRIIGGKGSDRVYNLEFFDNLIWTAGYITDTVQWGGIELVTTSSTDKDMFTGALEKDGSFSSANSYAGISGSWDEARAIFQNGDDLYVVMRSNSEVLILGDSIYTSDGTTFSLILGVIGCLPITVEVPLAQNITGCYGDSTGIITINASGGFGPPWGYSIDNGETPYSENPTFLDLPSGSYQTRVYDSENCSEIGPLVTLTQPDSLEVTTVVSDADCYGEDGSIEISTVGGTADFEFSSDSGLVYSPASASAVSTLNLPPGVYHVAVKDEEGCVTVVPEKDTIREPDVLEFEIISSGGTHENPESAGWIKVAASGGTEPYTYPISPIEGTTTFEDSISITIEATYSIYVEDANGCVATPVDTSITGLIDFLDVQVKVYPNPTSGIITLELPYDKNECSIQVFNLTGQLVLKKQVYSNGGMIRETLDLSSVSKGMYMIRIDGNSLSSAIIVN